MGGGDPGSISCTQLQIATLTSLPHDTVLTFRTMLHPKPDPLQDSETTQKLQITRVASYGVVCRGSEILLCRLSAEVPERQGWWTLPGGGVDFGEHPEEGMVREVLEETGYHVQATNLIGIDSIARDNAENSFHGIRILYNTQVVGGSMRYETKGTTDSCEWHPMASVCDLPVVELVENALELVRASGSAQCPDSK